MRQATLFDQMASQNGELNADDQSGNGFRQVRRLGRIPVDWSVRRIGECIISLDAGTSVGGEDRQIRKDERGILRVSAVSSGYLRPSEHKVIPDDRLDEVDVTPKADHLIVSRANTRELVGASAYVESDHPNLFLPDKLWQIEVDDRQVLPQWLHYVLWTPRLRFNIGNEATGSSGSMKNISQKRFKQLRIPAPPVEEQQQVLEYLVAWDRAIEQVDALIEKEKKRLHGLRQRLLTGRERFPECLDSGEMVEVDIGEVPADWTQKRLGDLFTWKTKRNEDNAIEKVITVGKDEIGDQEEHFNQSVASDDLSNYRIIEPGDFVYDPMSAYYGALGRYDLEEPGVVSPAYRVLQLNDGYHSDFVKFLLESHYVQFRIDASSLQNNKSGKRRGLRQDAFASIQVHIPPIEEQRRIAEVLDTAETEIEKLKEKRGALKRQKKGLMQRLLTGAVRTV
jgi:type I restriction enzyme S subunit